jgi:hypothetical protein
VVKLVDDRVIPVVGAKALEQARCVETLYGREEMVEPGRVTAASEGLGLRHYVAREILGHRGPLFAPKEERLLEVCLCRE